MFNLQPEAGRPRYSVRLLQWGDRNRYALVDESTDVVRAIRSTRAAAENEAIVRNLESSGPPKSSAESGSGLPMALPAVRSCGRCRKEFPLEVGQDKVTLRDWWLCEPCHVSLLGQHRARANSSAAAATFNRVGL